MYLDKGTHSPKSSTGTCASDTRWKQPIRCVLNLLTKDSKCANCDLKTGGVDEWIGA